MKPLSRKSCDVMKRYQPLIALCSLGLAACLEYGTTDGSEQAWVFPNDDEIIAKVYNNLYQVPDYFYVDERADTPASFTFYHVKDPSTSYELCTDDHYQALEWETADNDSRVVNGYYVGSYENDRYFEFIRELNNTSGVGNITDPTSPGFARVFKCSYVNRDGVDRNLRNGYAGTLNVRALSKDVIRTYAEYMWQFTFFWPAKKKVLETFSTETDSAFQHTLLLAFMTKQGADQCDLIEVVDWVFSVDKNDGHITKEFRFLYDIEARLVDNGIPQKC